VSLAKLRLRNRWGLAAIGLLLGPLALMLWLGRWKWALFYVVLTFVVIAGFFALPILGIINPPVFGGLKLPQEFPLLSLAISIVGLVHGFSINNGDPAPWYSRWYIALVLPVVLSLGAALTVRQFVYQPFNIPSASDVPTLMPGDNLFVSKFAYRNHPPQAGDMAVFRGPKDPEVDYVKRVVGVPGDKIQMVGGVLNINGEPVKREEVKLAPYFYADAGPTSYVRETLPNGRSYVTGEEGSSPLDDTEVFVVPDGEYFVLGDNRDNSIDSRMPDRMGFVPAENFVGPVGLRYWNDLGTPLTGRPNE